MSYFVTKFTLLYIFAFIFIPIIGVSGENADEESFVIRVENDLLTVRVRDVPLKKVLAEISSQTQIKFFLYAPSEKPFLASFADLPMEKALNRLLQDYNYSVIFDSEESKDGGHKIKKVCILSKEGESRYGNTETIIVSTEASGPEPISEEMLYEVEREEMERRRRIDEEEEDDENETTIASYSNEFQRENVGGRYQVPEEALTDEEEDERELREREERNRLDDEKIANETTAASFGDDLQGENAGGRLSNDDAIRMTSGGRTQRHKRIQTDISDEEREEREMRRQIDDEGDEEEDEQYDGHE